MSDANKPPQTVRYREGRGYEHPHFEWSPLTERAPVAWPGGARIAWCVYLYLEYLELDPPAGSVRDPRYGGALGSHFPDYLNYSHREHGNRGVLSFPAHVLGTLDPESTSGKGGARATATGSGVGARIGDQLFAGTQGRCPRYMPFIRIAPAS